MNAKDRNADCRPIGVDLFAGAGGMSLGFEQAGFDVVAAVEMDPIHCATHEYNFPYCRTICSSIFNVSGDELIAVAEKRGGKIDVVFGGPPCQGFSLIGKRAMHDPRNRLVAEFVRLVSETKARYFVFENVRGLTIGEHRKFLDELVSEFDERGYNVRLPWRVLNAVEYGVPQARQRVFLLGALKGLPLPEYPEPTTQSPDRSAGLFDLWNAPTVWDAIGDLPDVQECEALLESDSARLDFGPPSAYAAVLRGMSVDPLDYSYPRQYDSGLITSSLRTEHSRESQDRFAATPCGKNEIVSRFFKLDPGGVCNTLRAGTASDRGAFTSPRPIHPVYPRCITVREAARLHSYPDWFRFHVTKWHGARQVGNSVPPLLARAVSLSIMSAMGCTPSKPSMKLPLGDELLLKFGMKEACAYYRVPDNVIPQRTRREHNKIAVGEFE